jgi:formate-dependent nitrite reductase membrane component NrfD
MNIEKVMVKQKLWGEKVAIHLFLVGLAAGMYIGGSLLYLFNPGRGFTQVVKIATGSVIPLLVIGLIFLFSHLGNFTNARRAWQRPSSSWLARGSIALLAFLVLDIIQSILWLGPSAVLGEMPGLNAVLQVVTSIVALYILLYSGMLLATLKTFPFWRTWSLPLLFAVGGLTGGLMFLIFLATIWGNTAGNVIIAMVSWNSFFLLVLAAALIFLLWRSKTESSVMDSVHIMTGANRAGFYLGVITAGILVPFFLGIYIIFSGSSPVTRSVLDIVLAVLGLIGGYTLKSLVLKSGTSARLKMPAETVPLPETARVPASQRVRYR